MNTVVPNWGSWFFFRLWRIFCATQCEFVVTLKYDTENNTKYVVDFESMADAFGVQFIDGTELFLDTKKKTDFPLDKAIQILENV